MFKKVQQVVLEHQSKPGPLGSKRGASVSIKLPKRHQKDSGDTMSWAAPVTLIISHVRSPIVWPQGAIHVGPSFLGYFDITGTWSQLLTTLLYIPTFNSNFLQYQNHHQEAIASPSATCFIYYHQEIGDSHYTLTIIIKSLIFIFMNWYILILYLYSSILLIQWWINHPLNQLHIATLAI